MPVGPLPMNAITWIELELFHCFCGMSNCWPLSLIKVAVKSGGKPAPVKVNVDVRFFVTVLGTMPETDKPLDPGVAMVVWLFMIVEPPAESVTRNAIVWMPLVKLVASNTNVTPGF